MTEGYEAALGALRDAPYGGGEHMGAGVEAGRVLGEWEAVVRRIEARQGGTEAAYREGLGARDRIPAYVRALGAPVGALFREALGEVDGVFVRLTVVDEGWLVEGGGEHGWWWHRRPRQ